MVAIGCLVVRIGLAQGTFLWRNDTAPTRLHSIDGPLAGPGIWGQMLAGATPVDLFPLEMSTEHVRDGLVSFVLGEVAVPGLECRQTAYIQFVAWDGECWGTDLSQVPESQLGYTDTVPVILAGCFLDVATAPRFTQPAVVPPIPEPSTMALLLLAAGMAFLSTRRLRECRASSFSSSSVH